MQSRITVAHLPGDASDDHLLLPTSRVGHFPDFVAPNLNLLGLSIDCFKFNTKSFSLYSNKTVNINRNSTNFPKSQHTTTQSELKTLHKKLGTSDFEFGTSHEFGFLVVQMLFVFGLIFEQFSLTVSFLLFSRSGFAEKLHRCTPAQLQQVV